MLACSLSTQKTGRAGNGDDEPEPSPSPKEFECGCDFEEPEEGCFGTARRFCVGEENIKKHTSSRAGTCETCVKEEDYCLGGCSYYEACYVECNDGRWRIMPLSAGWGCKLKIPTE